MSSKKNILFLCSDQHSVYQTGCYGNELIKTPNIDALAKEGTLFTNAYTNNPICVPARAVIATGKYSHEIGCYDNASPYTGQAPSFGHALLQEGYEVTTIGKLHYRSALDDVGFPDQQIPLHVKDGVGDLLGIVRSPEATKPGLGNFVKEAHCGESSYITYDRKITEKAVQYLEEHQKSDRPWFLYVGYTLPHFPYISPEETWNWYDEKELPLPKNFKNGERPEEATIKHLRHYQGIDRELPEEDLRKMVHAYYGMCSYMDQQIGDVLDKLRELGMEEDTMILYTTDHGEMLGTKGAIGKNVMYEQAARIPLVCKGEGIPAGKRNDTLVSLLDIYPTIVDMAGGMPEPELKGTSILRFARQEITEDRMVFSEFHANGSYSSNFMLRNGKYKYIYSVGDPEVLFDLEEDPEEMHNLAEEMDRAEVLKKFREKLYEIVDPEKLNAKVKEEQMRIINENGGLEAILGNKNPILASPPPEMN